MKLRIQIPIVIGLALVLTAVISTGPITQNAYAAVSFGASGVNTGAGSDVGGVDGHLFCNTGVETPICK